MAATNQITVSNDKFYAVTTPNDCKQALIREIATVATPQGYQVAAPDSTNAVFTKLALESTELSAYPNLWPAGTTVCWLKTNTGSTTFTLLFT